jgi:hypothetical protein
VTADLVPGMAEAVEKRRWDLGLNPSAFAEAAGLTLPGTMPVRKGVRRNYEEKTRRGIARALQWPIDWYERLLAGEDPETFPGLVPVADSIDFNSRIARMPEHVRKTIEDIIDRFEEQERR